MKRTYLVFISISLLLLSFSSCEELISKGMDTDTVKKLRTENSALKVQVDKLQKQIKITKDDVALKALVISLYDLRHAVEKYALENKKQKKKTK